MKKLTKVSLALMVMIPLLLTGVVALTYAGLATLPPELVSLLAWAKLTPATQALIAPYVFWLALAIMLILVIGLLIIIFYPRTYTEIELEDGSNGTLGMKKAALEGFVRQLVQEEGLMTSPAVSVKLYKKTFKVTVSGKIVPRVGITEKIERLERQITTGLDTFFGITKKVDYKVVVTHIEPKKKTTSSRVE